MLTHEGALHVLQAAMDRAAAMGTPQCVAVVDDSGSLLAFVRMDGAKVLSIQTAQRKALTAADRRSATGGLEPGHDLKLALVTEGRLTNLKGGLPIIVSTLIQLPPLVNPPMNCGVALENTSGPYTK